MELLRASDVGKILRFVGEMYRVGPTGGFRPRMLARLRSLVPSDMTAWVETRTGRPGVDVVASPRDPLSDGPHRFARVRDQHPILAHFERSRHGGAVKLSDFVSPVRYHGSPLYHEFFRPAGVEHQISIALPSQTSRLVRITLNRASVEFSERDRQVLNLVRAHVAHAHRNAEALDRLGGERDDLEQAAEAADTGIIVMRDGQRAVYMNPRARQQLAAYFGGRSQQGRRVPEALLEWLRPYRHDLEEASLLLPRRPFCIERDGGRLEVRVLADAARDVLVLRERLTRISPRSLESLGLTRRQAEVLAWLAEGKANSEIAAILAISPNTVARHVEAIFAKLAVPTRTAAAATAFAHLASR